MIRGIARGTPLFAIEKALVNKPATPWHIDEGDIVDLARRNCIRWAFLTCLRSYRAIPGDPWEQMFSLTPPHLAYFNLRLNCEDCRHDFAFSAKEQRFWFEQLKFWVWARPKHCLKCRRRKRRPKQAQRALQTLLSQFDPTDPLQLVRAASLYLEVGSQRKASEFLRRAKNRAREQGKFDSLLVQIERMKQVTGEVSNVVD
jgi:hypothetical protein